MPVLAFLAVAALALVALLFVADATLQKGSPPIVNSSRVGLPERWRSDTIQVLTTTPAPAPDMTSEAVLAAQPKVAPTARAEAPPEDNHVMRPTDERRSSGGDRFSIGGQ